MTDTITLPRAVVEALVGPADRFVNNELGCCNYCEGDWLQTGPALGHGHWQHSASCPVRLVQEALAAAAKDT